MALNAYLSKPIRLRYTGQIFCVNCQKKTSKSFNQGYCYSCFIRLAACDLCIMKPETCHYAAGTCREPAWGEAFCFQPHIVYLANSSGIKVGITRQTQVPTRWLDQGAIQALPIFAVSSRHLAGLIEVLLAQYVSDKTSWQKMLKQSPEPLDLMAIRDSLLANCADGLSNIAKHYQAADMQLLNSADSVEINYPILHYPAKIKSVNLDKEPELAGVLQGIKGQYLLLDTGVINIRKYTGYQIEWLT